MVGPYTLQFSTNRIRLTSNTDGEYRSYAKTNCICDAVMLPDRKETIVPHLVITTVNHETGISQIKIPVASITSPAIADLAALRNLLNANVS